MLRTWKYQMFHKDQFSFVLMICGTKKHLILMIFNQMYDHRGEEHHFKVQ